MFSTMVPASEKRSYVRMNSNTSSFQWNPWTGLNTVEQMDQMEGEKLYAGINRSGISLAYGLPTLACRKYNDNPDTSISELRISYYKFECLERLKSDLCNYILD